MSSPADLRGLVLDACAVLNVAGAGLSTVEIAGALNRSLLVVEQVVAEALWTEELVDGETVRTAVDLASPIFAGLARTSLTEDELSLYVQLASQLDDGEAATIAVAHRRGLLVLTDDRKARRVAAERGVGLLGTPQLLRRVVERSDRSPQEVAELLLRVEHRARYSPRRDDPEREWWTRRLLPRES